jgi:hypothetical protein
MTSKQKKKTELTDRTFASATAHDPAPGLLNVLNLGAGVQSSVVLLMSLEGELPPIDHAIFANTGWEPAAVYRQLDWLQGKAEAAGVKVWRVATANLRDDAMVSQVRGKAADGVRWASLPYFVLGPDGERGQIRRQCTYEYKIRPIAKCIRHDVLGLKPRQRAPKEPVINQWFGISFDEMQRMRSAEDRFVLNWYPLVSRKMTRQSCREWLRTRGYPEAPRSACIGCPYRHNSEWRALKENPEEWQDAVEFDAAIRNCGGMRGEVFLHADRIPLPLVNLEKKYDPRQQTFGFDDECAGLCGV